MADGAARRVAWGTLNTATVVEAALGLIEDEGIDGLSIRRLADRLGVGRMALYRHVDSKDELLRLVLNEIAERELLADDGAELPWREELRVLAHRIRSQLIRYPGLGGALLAAGAAGPASRRFAERLLGVFARAGFRGRDLAVCYLIYVDTVVGRAHREGVADFAAAARMGTFASECDPEGPTPVLDAVARDLSGADPDALFEDMLDTLLEGFAARLTRGSGANAGD